MFVSIDRSTNQGGIVFIRRYDNSHLEKSVKHAYQRANYEFQSVSNIKLKHTLKEPFSPTLKAGYTSQYKRSHGLNLRTVYRVHEFR